MALSDGVVAGTYELVILDNMAKRGKRSGVVEDVAVSPDHQGKGIGRAMMQHPLEECRLAGRLLRDDAFEQPEERGSAPLLRLP